MKYFCWIPEYGHERADAFETSAVNSVNAAAHFIKWYEQRYTQHVGNGVATVEIAVAAGDAEPEFFIATGEPRPPTYDVRKKPKPEMSGFTSGTGKPLEATFVYRESQIDAYAREVWNAAIEAALNEIHNSPPSPIDAMERVAALRKVDK